MLNKTTLAVSIMSFASAASANVATADANENLKRLSPGYAGSKVELAFISSDYFDQTTIGAQFGNGTVAGHVAYSDVEGESTLNAGIKLNVEGFFAGINYDIDSDLHFDETIYDIKYSLEPKLGFHVGYEISDHLWVLYQRNAVELNTAWYGNPLSIDVALSSALVGGQLDISDNVYLHGSTGITFYDEKHSDGDKFDDSEFTLNLGINYIADNGFTVGGGLSHVSETAFGVNVGYFF